VYNIGGAICINGQVDIDLLRQAINLLIVESDALKLLFREHKYQVFQFVGQKEFPEMEFVDFSGQENAKQHIQQWLEKTFRKPFNLDGKHYLYHYALLKESDTCFHLMGKYHHLISDGLSSKIASDRISELYNGLLENYLTGNIPKENSQAASYTDFIELQNIYVDSSTWQRDADYWAKQLPYLSPPLVEKRYSGDNQQKTQSKTKLPQANIYRFKLEDDFYQELQLFATQYKSSSYHLLLVALGLYFGRVYQRDDILFGVPSLNRSGARFKAVLGMFIGMSPLLLEIKKDLPIGELLKSCGATLRQLYRHQRYPLGAIGKRLEIMRNKRDTLFDLVVSYERQEYASDYGGANITGQQLFSGVARYPLAVTICEFHQNQGVEVVFEGAENAFSQTDLMSLGKRIKALLRQIILAPEKQVSEFNLLTERDNDLLFSQFNQLHYNEVKLNMSAPDTNNFLQIFKAQVEARPDAIALEYLQQQYSYRKLDEWSNRLAHYLIEQGAKAEQIIALYLPRCSEMIVAILAVLKSGAAYLPIDPDLPLARIKKILSQSQSTAVLTMAELQPRLSSLHKDIIALDLLKQELQFYPNYRPDLQKYYHAGPVQ